MTLKNKLSDLKKTTYQKKTNIAIHTVDTIWRFDSNGLSPSLLLGRMKTKRRALVKANWLALKGEKQLAADFLSSLILTDTSYKEAIISLGGLLSQADIEDPKPAWSKLRKQWLSINKPEKINKHNFPFFALGTDLALRCEPELGKRAIKNIYFPFIWKHERKINKKDQDPIFYWHVPKTGGTSFNAHISNFWYKNGTFFLPAYTTRCFFRTVLQLQDGILPYLHSAHLSTIDIEAKFLNGYQKVVVLRDPKDRAMSAWRQYREAPYKRLLILPQHGFIWNFLPSKNFNAWIESVPDEILNIMNYTFCRNKNDLKKVVDYSVPIDNLDSFGLDLMDSLGADSKDMKKFRVSKNTTDKSIKDRDIKNLSYSNYFEKDYSMIETLSKIGN